MEMKDFEPLALDIMRRADMLVLATTGTEPYPHQRALFNLRNAAAFPSLAAFHEGKGLSVFLGTNTSSIKLGQIGASPWVSVYFMIPAEFKGLCLSGKAAADPAARSALWLDGWEVYYPKGRDDPDYTALRIDPVRARGWNSMASFDVEP
jgi:general stress protein 26